MQENVRHGRWQSVCATRFSCNLWTFCWVPLFDGPCVCMCVHAEAMTELYIWVFCMLADARTSEIVCIYFFFSHFNRKFDLVANSISVKWQTDVMHRWWERGSWKKEVVQTKRTVWRRPTNRNDYIVWSFRRSHCEKFNCIRSISLLLLREDTTIMCMLPIQCFTFCVCFVCARLCVCVCVCVTIQLHSIRTHFQDKFLRVFFFLFRHCNCQFNRASIESHVSIRFHSNYVHCEMYRTVYHYQPSINVGKLEWRQKNASMRLKSEGEEWKKNMAKTTIAKSTATMLPMLPSSLSLHTFWLWVDRICEIEHTIIFFSPTFILFCPIFLLRFPFRNVLQCVASFFFIAKSAFYRIN